VAHPNCRNVCLVLLIKYVKLPKFLFTRNTCFLSQFTISSARTCAKKPVRLIFGFYYKKATADIYIERVNIQNVIYTLRSTCTILCVVTTNSTANAVLICNDI